MRDLFGREIDYLRVSITDRCNLRCRYCIPEDVCLVPMEEILSYEEIETVCQCAAKLGISKIKVTGGEPLVRKGAPELIGRLKNIPGICQVTMTTNGVLLTNYLDELVKNGLDGVNISLDTLDETQYQKITGKAVLPQVLEGIEAAADSGLRTKINVVLQKSTLEGEWRKLIQLAKHRDVDVRFIELMPIGAGAGMSGESNEALMEKVRVQYPNLCRDGRVHGNGPAVYYHIPGFMGCIGLISAVHGRFCSGCNRIRMSAQGEIKPCLCYEDVIPLKPVLRSGKLEDVQEALAKAIREKPGEHCFGVDEKRTEHKPMVSIGG